MSDRPDNAPADAKPCPKCHHWSGNDWTQCGEGPCPMRSPGAAPVESAPPTYELAHITDLANIPPAHWDEAMRVLQMGIGQLMLIRELAAQDGHAIDLRTACPVIRFTPDGDDTVTARMPGCLDFVVRRDPAKPETR